MLMTFSRDLGGVALSFKDVQPVSKVAKILYENPGVHLRVRIAQGLAMVQLLS